MFRKSLQFGNLFPIPQLSNRGTTSHLFFY
uniref:Uncharacterized protein n=1 Tax=Anguilla anguilla TaxID=7936 RepID=A0A0E9Q8S2_ANGAN